MRQTNRLRYSFNFLITCFQFFKKNKGLMVLPILSMLTLACILIALYYGIYHLVKTGELGHFVDEYKPGMAFLTATLLGLYFLLSYIHLFFNAALVFCVMHRMKNEPCPVSHGLILALKKSGHLFQWTLISASILLLINQMERINSRIADVLSAVFGFSWSMCATFVLPIMVSENIGPITAFKQAIRLIGKGWRKILSLNLFFLALLLGIVGIGKLIYAFYPQLFAVLPILPILIIFFLINFIIIQTINTIYSCGLYLDIKGEEIHGISKQLLHTLVEHQ